MKNATLFLIVVFGLAAQIKGSISLAPNLFMSKDSLPMALKGNFIDDYGIRYRIDDSIWMQYPGSKYHILRWNSNEHYLITRNDERNPSQGGLFTRIDFMYFENMEPFRWGFCLTVYDAKSDSAAEAGARADSKNPKKGCNGFPFSRMKRNDEKK